MWAIFKREFKAYFTTPIAYLVLAGLFAWSGFMFTNINLNGGSTNLGGVYSSLYIIVMLVLVPLITMRSFSEEKRQRTDQALLTAPVKLTSIVLGKFLAAMLLFALMLSITFVYAIVISTQVKPDWMVIFGNYVGLLLLAGLVIAAGLAFSSMTESQFIAFVLTCAFSLLLQLLDSAVQQGALSFLSVYMRYYGFTQGFFRYDDVFFFFSMQALFLFLTVRLLDRKRWS